MENVLLVSDIEYFFFCEYIKTFCDISRIIIYNNTTKPFTENIYYLCIRRIPYEILPTECKIGFINTEQLTVSSKLEEYNTTINSGKNIDIFDYSLYNISISGKGTFLPYLENKKETNYLKSLMPCKKEYDIAIIGHMSPHRQEIIDKLKQQGYSVYFIVGWGNLRDKEIAKCKCIVNLHYTDEYQIYEVIRCNRWQFAGMPIYSEPCIDGLPNGVKDYSILMEGPLVNLNE